MKITYLGQVVSTKGITELVTACSSIFHAELILIGPVDNNYKEELKTIFVTKKNKNNQLEFTGEISRNQALKKINKSDIFTLPSYREAFPISVLEAMALSKPIIATTVGALSEILDINGDEQCGICVPPRNTEILQEAISEMVNDENMRKLFGKRSRCRIEKYYSSEKVFSEWITTWNTYRKK